MDIFRSKGEKLKHELGLGKFKYVLIQRALGISLPIFVISFDSRFPKVLLSISKIRNLKFTWLGRLKSSFDYDDVQKNKLKFTPPLRIETADVLPRSNAVVLLQDLAGEHYRQPRMFEYIENDSRVRLKEIK